MKKEKIILIGSGLSGPLMANYLARKGYNIKIYERRPDMRKVSQSAGRSINLALSSRGIYSLKEVGVYKEIQPFMIPMKGRMIHDLNGSMHLQPYGQRKHETIFSVSRAKLNKELMNSAEKTGKISIKFEQELKQVDLINNKLTFNDLDVPFDTVIGCDGSSSVLRQEIVNRSKSNYLKKPLNHGYKELTISASKSNNYSMEPNALHIWPRSNFMMIALPNIDKTFTCTLFLPMKGPVSFSSINTNKDITELFKSFFPDVIKLMPKLIEDFQINPTGNLSTVYCEPWNYKGKACIIGDAAHAIVPFFGQGMNASFQDCSFLNELIHTFKGDWGKAFDEFSNTHVKNGHAIADMAIENYIEMRDLVNDPIYIERRNLEFELEKEFPERFIPRYSMVSFHKIPYSEVYQRGRIQMDLMNKFQKGLISKIKLNESIINQLEPLI